MNEHLYRWRNRQLREHVSVIDGELAPTKLLKQATYLNVFLKKWMTANIWIYEDRIVYVGEDLPDQISPKTEVIDCRGQYLVPGYIEPHSHPFQLYNPHSLAEYALKTGTTTLVNDNCQVDGYNLHVKGEISIPASGYELIQEEIIQGSFNRTIELPYKVRDDKVNARYEHGLVFIQLYKDVHEDKKARSIKIKEGDK